MKQILIAGLLVLHQALMAQNFVGQAALPPVSRDGFYKIRLSPDVVSLLTPGFANVRIIDTTGAEVPYLIEEESPVFSTTSFREYKVEKNIREGCCTELILDNAGQAPINNISLLIRNAETRKQATLQGSDDRKQWYALKETFQLYEIDNEAATSEIRILDFPLSNYSHYKLTIDDSTTAPLNIVKAGYYEVATNSGRYMEIPKVKFTAGDSPTEKKTYVNITLDTTGLIDMLELELKGPAFYHRSAELYARRWTEDARKQKTESLEWLESFDLTSRQTASVRLSSVRAMELLLVIDNGDNPALTVQSVRLSQLNRFLVAWLTTSAGYKVKVGDELLASPVYDIRFFQDSIPADPPVLTVSAIELYKKVGGESFTLFTNRNIIWVAIIAVIALLGYMSRNMIGKMGKG
jgi:hypothetical protein